MEWSSLHSVRACLAVDTKGVVRSHSLKHALLRCTKRYLLKASESKYMHSIGTAERCTTNVKHSDYTHANSLATEAAVQNEMHQADAGSGSKTSKFCLNAACEGPINESDHQCNSMNLVHMTAIHAATPNAAANDTPSSCCFLDQKGRCPRHLSP